MAQVSNLYRRPSGIYVVRLVVPVRLRAVVGKREVHLTTGTRTPAVAKAVACGLLAHWRERFLSLGRMDIEQVMVGSPALSGGGTLRLSDASRASGLSEDELLREAEAGRLRMMFRSAGLTGHFVSNDDLADHLEDVRGRNGTPSGPLESEHTTFNGTLHIRDAHGAAAGLLGAASYPERVFERAPSALYAFVPDNVVTLTRANVEVLASEVEAARVIVKASVTDEQLAARKARPASGLGSAKSDRRVSEGIDAYMADKAKTCAPDHARRIRTSCLLLVTLEGDLRVGEFGRDQFREFIAKKLPRLPAQPAKLQLQHKGKEPDDWPRLSTAQQGQHTKHVAGLFAWLTRERWIDIDPCVGLAASSGTATRKTRSRNQDARDAFTAADLSTIFAAPWWKDGRGMLTRAGTYREFTPMYYWLPLLGLFTGARINELCQLFLDDIRVTDAGVWFISVSDDGDDQKIKNANSRRQIPLHLKLIELGFLQWRDRLVADGHSRLFPELLFDQDKGFSKAAVKWFSRFLEGLGWERNGKKVFHSFRHTLVNKCVNDLEYSEAIVSQISGHARGSSVLMQTYRKDVPPDELVDLVQKIDFGLPEIGSFDVEAGVAALRDALRRKKSVR